MFVFEKCLHPKNPLYADSGLGCAHLSTRWDGLVISVLFVPALAPHSKNTIGVLRSLRCLIMLSVIISHP